MTEAISPSIGTAFERKKIGITKSRAKSFPYIFGFASSNFFSSRALGEK